MFPNTLSSYIFHLTFYELLNLHEIFQFLFPEIFRPYLGDDSSIAKRLKVYN